MNHLHTALHWHHAGFNVIPTNKDKQPLVSWKKWQTEAQTEEEVRTIFANDCHGIGLVCGHNNIEAIDVDIKADPDGKIVEQINGYLKQSPYNLINSYAYQTTPSGGCHLIYRCEEPPAGNNGNLARKNGKAIIETRGSGGYVAIAPTPGYKMWWPERMGEVMPEAERLALMELAASFNEDAPVGYKEYKPKQIEGDDTRPGTLYDRDHGRDEVVSLLEHHGWKVEREHTNIVHLCRPGKDRGVSGNWHDKHHKFYCHTPHAQPLLQDTAYSPFALLTVLEYGGDWSAAARSLAPVVAKNETVEQRVAAASDDKWKDAYVYNPYEDDGSDKEKWIINYETTNKSYEFLARGFMLSIGGMEKSRKSRFLYTLAAGGLTGDPLLGFRWQESPRRILIFDTEQPTFWLKRAGRYITRIVGNKDWNDVLTFHGIRSFTDEQRLDYIEEKTYLARSSGIVDMIIIDGLADLIDDFNDLGKSTRTINRLMMLQEDSIMAGVIHLNKGVNNNYERGHLGSIWTKKADSIVRLTYNEETNYSTVRCHRSRTIPFPEFEFTQDKNGNVVLTQPLIDPKEYIF